MQTWARRGMQAALVTGGMLAAGTGVASASENCPERPTSPLEPLTPAEAAGDGTPSRSGLCFAGELFPEGRQGESGSQPVQGVSLAGTVDPVNDLLDQVGNEMTQRIPRITDEPAPDANPRSQWIPPELAGERAPRPELGHTPAPRTGTSRPPTADAFRAGTDSFDRVAARTMGKQGVRRERGRGRHAAMPEENRPADGFHRSVSWSGPIGSVIDTAPIPRITDDAANSLPPALVVPATDPAKATLDVERPTSLIALWRESAEQDGRQAAALPTPMISTRAMDLTTGRLDSGYRVRTVPNGVLRAALDRVAGRTEVRDQEVAPLDLPGEAQAPANEVPHIEDPAALKVASGGSAARSDVPDVETTLPMGGELSALDSEVHTAELPRIDQALDSGRFSLVEQVAESGVLFSRSPESSQVTVTTLDELAAAIPERRVVATNPFRERSSRGRTVQAAGLGGMSLPMLGDPTQIDLLQGHTAPMPALSVDGTPLVASMPAPKPAASMRGV